MWGVSVTLFCMITVVAFLLVAKLYELDSHQIYRNFGGEVRRAN